MSKLVQGVLQVSGSLTGNSKFEAFIVRVGDGQLIYYSTAIDESRKRKKKHRDDPARSNGGALDIVPLTGASIEQLQKKEKSASEHSVVVVGAGNNKKWRTIFCADSAEFLIDFINGLQSSIDLATSHVFGTTIEDACYKANKYVPFIVEECVKEIDKHLKTEGLFRVPGDKTKLDVLVTAFNRGEIPNLAGEDVHLVCSLLKNYIGELRDPLIPFRMFKQFISAANSSEANRVKEVKAAVADLPETNRSVLAFLVSFLHRVMQESKSNRMDSTNLGVVFGPTFIRKQRGDEEEKKSKAQTQGLEEMASSNRCIEIFLGHKDEVFSPQDFTLSTQKMFDSDLQALKSRDVMTAMEKSAVETFIKPHQYGRGSKVLHNTINYLVNIRNSKTKELEPRILVADQNRVYLFFKGGKEELHFHLLELREVASPSKATLTLAYQLASDKVSNSLEIHPISYASHDLDKVINWVHSQYELTFIGRLLSEKFTARVDPLERAQEVLQIPPIDVDASCGGLVRSYISVCDWKGAPVSEDILWDLDNYFAENEIRTFNLTEIINKDKFTTQSGGMLGLGNVGIGPISIPFAGTSSHAEKNINTDFEALVFCLQHNLWFNEFHSYVALGNDSMLLLGDCFKYNRAIKILDLKDGRAGDRGMFALFNGFLGNHNLAVTKLYLSGNDIDARTLALFNDCLQRSLGRLVVLDISNTNLPRKSIPMLVETISSSTTLLSTLTELDLGRNKFDDACCEALGHFLAKTKALSVLKLAATSIDYFPVIKGIIDALGPGTTVGCESLFSLDVSENPIKAKAASELVSFCKYLPNLDTLNIAGAISSISFADNLIELLKNNQKLTDLDISDIDLTDEGFISFFDFITREETPMIRFEKLTVNYAFQKRGKNRTEAMRAISRALNAIPVREFHFKGGKNAALKSDLVDMVFGLMNNRTLEVLDISGHQGGDSIAPGIAKVLQHNTTLHTLYLDSNTFTVAGLQYLRLGLMRNSSIKFMPLPLVDIANLLRAEELFQLAKDIQKKLYENQVGALQEDEGDIGGDVSAPQTPNLSDSTPEALMSPRSALKKAFGGAHRNARYGTFSSFTTPKNTSGKAERRQKRRSIYDENRAAILFGGHGTETPQTPRDTDGDDATTEDDTTGTEENSTSSSTRVLHKANSLKALGVPDRSSTPTTSSNPSPSTSTSGKKSSKTKDSTSLLKKTAASQHTRRRSGSTSRPPKDGAASSDADA